MRSCMCMSMVVQRCACAVKTSGWHWLSSLITFHCRFWDNVCQWTWSSPILLEWEVSEFRRSVCLHPAHSIPILFSTGAGNLSSGPVYMLVEDKLFGHFTNWAIIPDSSKYIRKQTISYWDSSCACVCVCDLTWTSLFTPRRQNGHACWKLKIGNAVCMRDEYIHYYVSVYIQIFNHARHGY